MDTILNILFISRRNLSSRKIRALLTVTGVLLGVSVVLAIQVTNQTTIDSLRSVFNRAIGSASLLIVPSAEKEEYLKENLLPTIQSINGVTLAVPTLIARTLPADEADDWKIAINLTGVASGNFFLLYGIDPALDPQVRVYELADGRMPQSGRYEIVLPKKYAEDKNLRVGNFFILLTPSGTTRLKICGLLADEGVALINDGVVGFTNLKVVQDQFGPKDKFDEIAIKVPTQISDRPNQLEALKNTIQQRIGAQGDVVYPEARGQIVGQMLATYQLGLSLFSIIAIFVGAYLVYNTFSMTVAERTREIGMLRAIGMSRKQTLLSVMGEALLISIVGSALGIPLGLVLARGLIRMTGSVITPVQGFLSLGWNTLFQAILVGVGVALAASLYPAWQAAHISPMDALRVHARRERKSSQWLWISGFGLILFGFVIIYGFRWPEAWLFTIGSSAVFSIFSGATLTVTLAVRYLELLTRSIARQIYGNEGALGSANVRRSISRTTLTVASLMVALTMIISITSVSNSFKKDMSAWIDSALGGDLYVRSAVPMRESFGRQLRSVPGVAVVTPTRVITVRAAPESLPEGVQQNDFYFNAIDPDSYRKIADLQFTSSQGNSEENWARFKKGGAVFISNVTSDRYQLSQGDKITLLTHRGKQDFTIAGVILDFTGQRGVIYGTYQDLHLYFAEQGADRFTLKVADGYSVSQVADEIEKRYQKRRHISLQTTQDFKEGILELVERSFNLFDVLGFIGVIIGGLGVVNTLTMNIIERQREIGGLRSIGMTRTQVVRMVLAEALAHGIMGGIYGLIFGYLIAQVMILGMNLMIGYDLVYRFTLQPYLIGVILALGIAQLAAYAPARRAARVNIIDAIKHE